MINCLSIFNILIWKRILSTCGHTFCLDCLAQLAARNRGVITCPDCRKKLTLEEPYDNSALKIKLVTNNMAIPGQNELNLCKQEKIISDFKLLDNETIENEERINRPEFAEISTKIIRKNSKFIRLIFTYILVYFPLILTSFCQISYVFFLIFIIFKITNMIIMENLECEFRNDNFEYVKISKTLYFIGLLATICWIFGILPLFISLLFYNKNEKQCVCCLRYSIIFTYFLAIAKWNRILAYGSSFVLLNIEFIELIQENGNSYITCILINQLKKLKIVKDNLEHIYWF